MGVESLQAACQKEVYLVMYGKTLLPKNLVKTKQQKTIWTERRDSRCMQMRIHGTIWKGNEAWDELEGGENIFCFTSDVYFGTSEKQRFYSFD